MLIDRQLPICGLKPADLKKLLRRERFSTLTAMDDLDLDEPAISRTLADLEADGWLEHVETIRYVDHWRSTEQGDRLSATRLIKRFPVREGRAIVERVVEEARAINANPLALRRVKQLFLFGSVLTGADDDLAGDIDLVVVISRRTLGAVEEARVEAAESAELPDRLGFFERLVWAEQQMMRRIKSVSNKITVHGYRDLEATGAPHQLIYAYDIENECELPPDPVVRQLAVDESRPRKPRKGPRVALPVARDWPVAPNAPEVLPHTDLEALRRAQHMWMRGASLVTISRRTRLSQKAAQAYLAGRRDKAERQALQFDASLERTISQALPPDFQHRIHVRLSASVDSEPAVETIIFDALSYDELVNIRRFTRLHRIYHGRCDLLAAAEPINDAAWFWLQQMRGKLRGVGLDAWVGFSPHSRPVPLTDPNPMDFRPLGEPMLQLFRRQVPPPRWDHRLEVVFDRRIEVNYWTGHPFYGRSTSKRITKPNAGEVWTAAKSFLARYAGPLSTGGGYTVFVWGQQLKADERGSDDDDEVARRKA